MAKAARITIKTPPKKGTSASVSGSVPCNICKGTGRLPKGYNKSKK